MATLYVSEFKKLKRDSQGNSVLVGEEPATAQTVSFTGTSGASSAFANTTNFVHVISDAACHVTFLPDPTATTSMRLLPANQGVYFGVPHGASYKVAARTTA